MTRNCLPQYRWMVRSLLTALALVLLTSCHESAGPTSVEPAPSDPWFEDVTEASSIRHTYDTGAQAGHIAMIEQVGGSAGLIDFDGDGLFDVFLLGGGTYTGPNDRTIVGRPCKLEAAARDSADDACKRLRDADAAKEYGKGLGVVAVDVNGDGKPDVFVACDTVKNLLYINRSRPGRILFEEMSLQAGVASDDRGIATGSMGVDACDYNGCLRPSLWCVNYVRENHSLYGNECSGDRVSFHYDSQKCGITAIGQNYVGWGTSFVDFDRGGLQHLFISNGHVLLAPQRTDEKRAQPPLLMQCVEDGSGQRTFKDVTRRHGGGYCARPHCGRGVAFGDLANDGHVDLVLVPLDEPVAVLKSIAGQGNHWIGFELKRKNNRDPVGAKVILEAGGKKQARFAKSGGSYLAANDPRHLFGLGQTDKIDKVTVTWPDLHEESWEGLTVDRYWKLTEGSSSSR